MKIKRASLSSKTPGVDITVKSAQGFAKEFAPTWEMVMGHKDGTVSDAEYTAQYRTILDQASKEAWRWVKTQATEGLLTLLCYCPDGKFCHTHLMIEYMVGRWPQHFEDGRNQVEGRTLCFTGHRPNKLGGYDERNPTANTCKALLSRLLEKAYQQGFRKFISGMAIGVDTWAAEAVIELRKKHPDVKLIAAVPFPQQACAWPSYSEQRWWQILRGCDELWLTNRDEETTMDALTMELQLKDAADQSMVSYWLNGRNQWMVDRSDCVLAVWNGSPGGTGNCVKYAQSKGKKIICVNPKDWMIKTLK